MCSYRIDGASPLTPMLSSAQVKEFNQCKLEAEIGNVVAMKRLAEFYDACQNGLEAYKWFKLCGKKGDIESMQKCALMVWDALAEISFDENLPHQERESLLSRYEAKLQKWTIRIVRAGDANGWVVLADYLWEVKGQIRLDQMKVEDEAIMALEVRRVQPFRAQAIGYYMLAAKAQNLEAAKKLKECYWLGEGVKHDPIQAKYWAKFARSILAAKA
jgi:TPR repeat protein